jgi:hypothetical protein
MTTPRHMGDMVQALTSELEGLEARLAAAGGDDAPADVKANLDRRIGEVHHELGKRGWKPPAAEKRPGGRATEKRET